jgi:hypothetical protein
MKRISRNRIFLVAAVPISLCMMLATRPAWSDQWTALLTPTAVHIEDDGGVPAVYINTVQAVINPAGCPSSDGYTVNDPLITSQSLAIVLTAMTSGQQIMLYISSSTCAVNGRPLATMVQLQ